MRTTSYFSADYAEARGKFRDAAGLARARLETYRNPAPGPGGVALTTETAWLGPLEAERLLVLMSGTHGVEGFCGSGLQVGLLSSGIASELPAGVALLMIHVINPSGFARIRRVTEGNVDLNRNFVDHTRPYPANPAYDQLHEAICPVDWSGPGRAAADAILEAYGAKHGAMALQTAISAGQFTDPNGLFFGGHAPTWSNLTLREILRREGAHARHVAFVDLHAGLGIHGVGEIINNHLSGHPGFRRVMDWYGAEATSTEHGSSSSAIIIGDVTIGVDESLPKTAVTAITLEFGTEPKNDIRDVLRAENWLHIHGRVDSAEGRVIQERLRLAFYPDTDSWRKLVWDRTVEVVQRTFRALAESSSDSDALTGPSARRRGPLGRFMAQYRATRETQQTLFDGIVRRNADTEFGREHGFAGIRAVADYQRQVPIREWRDLGPYVDRVIDGNPAVLTAEAPYFYHRTTGTTGKPKMIPFTRRCEASSKLTHRTWIYKNLQDNPGLVDGRIMAILNAGVDGYTPRREVFGSVSGNIFFRMPSIIRRAYSHPYEVYHVTDIESRRYTLLRFAVEQSCSFVFTGNPSSLLGIFEYCERNSEQIIKDIHDGGLAGKYQIPDSLRAITLNELHPNPARARALAKARSRTGRFRPVDYWPDLQVIGCWIGGSMGHFAPSLREWCGDGFQFRDVGYMASEGIFSIPLSNNSPDGVLALHGIFFEFVPENEFGKPDARALQAHEIEQGRNYHVVITTTGGLYRYAMNDVIRVTASHSGSPMIRFLYKGGNVKNLQGEMVTIDHVMSAITALTTEAGIRLRHFQVSAEAANRRYVVHIEPASNLEPPLMQQLLNSFERELGNVNENYAMFRADELIAPPCLRVMSEGWFDRIQQEHMARSGRDSQFKPSVLVNSVEHPEMVSATIELA